MQLIILLQITTIVTAQGKKTSRGRVAEFRSGGGTRAVGSLLGTSFIDFKPVSIIQ
jgi:hypothetical protein